MRWEIALTKKRREKGLTLLELLVTLLLFSGVTAVTFSMIKSYARVLNKSAANDSVISGIQVCMTRIRNEVKSAYSVELPAMDSASTRLQLSVWNRPHVPPSPLPLDWDPLQPARRQVVRYDLVHEALRRRTGGPAGSDSVAAYKVGGVRFEALEGLLRVRFSFREGQLVKSYASSITAPCLHTAP